MKRDIVSDKPEPQDVEKNKRKCKTGEKQEGVKEKWF